MWCTKGLERDFLVKTDRIQTTEDDSTNDNRSWQRLMTISRIGGTNISARSRDSLGSLYESV